MLSFDVGAAVDGAGGSHDSGGADGSGLRRYQIGFHFFLFRVEQSKCGVVKWKTYQIRFRSRSLPSRPEPGSYSDSVPWSCSFRR